MLKLMELNSAIFIHQRVLGDTIWSGLDRPLGSFIARTSALTRTRHTVSFRLWCLLVLPKLLRQERPWCPLGSTELPQRHSWGSHSLLARCRPAAISTASLPRF